MSDKRKEDDLQRLLRLGDPAADGDEMTPDEIAEMRRTVLAEATRASERGSWQPFLSGLMRPVPAAATAVAVLIVAGLWLYPWGASQPASPRTEAPAVADASPTPPETGGQGPAVGEELTSPTTAEPSAPAPPPPTTPVTVAEAPGPAPAREPTVVEPAPQPGPVADGQPELMADAEPASDRQSRTVQFTSPRGTRIIWTLDPNYESPIARSRARQEQGK